MARRRLRTVLREFLASLQECRGLSDDAYRWSIPGANTAHPTISQLRRDQITETAFLLLFLAWENFLEESFVLYLSGEKPPRGRPPHRYTFPPNHRTACEWVIPEGRPYARWTNATEISTRAERFFRAGQPFAPVLRGNLNTLEEIRTIRNAIAHRSTSSQEKFEKLVRTKLGTLPPRLSVGRFLVTTEPRSTPPASFLEFYIGKIEFAAQQIVPS